MASIFAAPFYTAIDSAGRPIAGATGTFYQTGTDDLATVYSDAAGTVPLTQPILADSSGRFPAIYTPDDTTLRFVLRSLAGTTLGDVDPVNAESLAGLFSGPTGATLVGYGSETVADALNSEISLDPAEIITVTADTVLGPTGINRAILVSGGATAVTLSMPSVGSGNIGDCVFVMVDPAFAGLVTCTGYPASGNLFGELPNRIMHAGETALVRFTGAGWTKVAGVTHAFAGQLAQASGGGDTNTSPTNWKTIPLTLPDPDNEPTEPWFSTDHVVIPRRGWWSFTLQVWFDTITMAAPNYTTPVGTEQGVPVDIGFTTLTTYAPDSAPVDFQRFIVHAGQNYQTFEITTGTFYGPGQHVGAVFRCGSAALTSIRATYVNGQIRSRMIVRESPVW